MLKTFIIGAALATMIGVPAMAQSYDPNVGSGNIVGAYSQPYSGPTVPRSGDGYSAYGSADEGGYGGAYAFAPAHDHGDYGHYRAHQWDRD